MSRAARGSGPRDEAPAWWRSYFDDDFVHLYTPFLPAAQTRAEVSAVIKLLGLSPGDAVLDLACGWGRHSLELARRGLRVTGLDLSGSLLAHARRRAARAHLAVGWVQADMRELPWTAEFDAVLSLFSSLGYFLSDAEDLRVLRAVRRALRPGGVFLLETMHRDLIARDFAERDWWAMDDGTTVWVEREFDAVAGVSHERTRWLRADGRSGEKRHALRVRSATEWATLFATAGLQPLGWYGGWDASPFTRDSERLIVVAQ